MLDQPGRSISRAPAPVWGPWLKIPRRVRDLQGLPPVLARSGPFELRLATTKKEIRKAQRLRYRVFYAAGTAVPDFYKASLQRDKCPFDRVCDHLLVVDTATPRANGTSKERVVGTYRLLRDEVAVANDGFYSETEFRLAPLLARHRGKRFLELGRSCVHPEFRTKRVIELLWRGIGLYAEHHGIDVLIGCSSLAGTRAESLALPLSFAFHHAASPPEWQVAAIPARATRMNWLDRDAIEPRRALAGLPPLLKAYVRAGGSFASEAAVDHEFGTIDLFTVLPLAAADPRYLAQFGAAPLV